MELGVCEQSRLPLLHFVYGESREWVQPQQCANQSLQMVHLQKVSPAMWGKGDL